MTRIILASTSPRRKELMHNITDDFICIKPDYEEVYDNNLSALENIQNYSYQKALSIAKNSKDDIVIGCDTAIIFNNKIYGKPKDINDAINTLQLFSNNTHQVVSGLTVIYKDSIYKQHVISNVTFKQLNINIINDYIRKVNVLDKAGSYAIQQHGDMLIKHVDKDYFNIVGLPLSTLNNILNTIYF